MAELFQAPCHRSPEDSISIPSIIHSLLMKITIHGHRPACLASPEPEQRAGTSAPASPENVKKIDLGFFKLKIHQRRAGLDQPRPRAMGKADYFAQWDAWARAARGWRETRNRKAAVREMKERIGENNLYRLHSKGLSSLPENLPPFLKYLSAYSNQLTRLPENLPSSLTDLDVENNQLTSLPENLPSSLRWLNAHSNQLTSLPENLPSSLVELRVANNQLTSLPENSPLTSLPENTPLTRLPENTPLLVVLDVSGNQLTSLPENLLFILDLYVDRNRLISLPESLPLMLSTLNASGNQLTSLPENLPSRLEKLDVSGNRLTSLPENLPSSLRQLNVSGNQLTSLPANFPSGLHRDCRVNLENNPLPVRVLQRLNEVMNARDYTGPRVQFSMGGVLPAAPTHVAPVAPLVPVAPSPAGMRSLTDAIAAWYPDAAQQAARETWTAFANEPGATEFSQFLNRLRGTVNYGNPQFRANVVAWLSHLGNHAQLRKDSFLISLGATASCEDRVSVTFNDMKKLCLANAVENGQYDHRLPALLSLAKGMFRLDKLAEIAREKVNSLNFFDEVEVYLAYQVKLRTKLELPLDTPDMRFFDVSWVTAADLKKAEKDVKAAEKRDFFHYLSTHWQPMQSVLERLHGEQYRNAKDELMTAIEVDFPQRLQTRLREDGLEGDADAERTVGAQVMREITQEINGRLVRDFLRSKRLEHLLPSPA